MTGKPHLSKSIFAAMVAGFVACTASADDFELINNGAVIANTSNSNNDNTAFPSVVKVPDRVAAADRGAHNATYCMYCGNHSGEFPLTFDVVEDNVEGLQLIVNSISSFDSAANPTNTVVNAAGGLFGINSPTPSGVGVQSIDVTVVSVPEPS